MSFFDEFTEFVPYHVSISVGKNKPSKKDPKFKSKSNHTGKLVAFYQTAKTPEEIAEHKLGSYVTYEPADKVSLPIDIQIICDIPLYTKYEFNGLLSNEKDSAEGQEKYSSYTHRKITEHSIRLYTKEGTYIGYVSLQLTPAGDILQKHCYYRSPDATEELSYDIDYKFKDGQLIKFENTCFTKKTKETAKTASISLVNGVVVGRSVSEERVKTDNEETEGLHSFISSCVCNETDIAKRGNNIYRYWDSMTLEDDLLAYSKSMHEFQQYVRRIQAQTGKSFTIDSAIEFGKKTWDEKESFLGFSPTRFNLDKYLPELAEFLADGRNNRLKGYPGDYIGNILKLTDKGYIACIVTKQSNLRFYTLIDLRGAHINQPADESTYGLWPTPGDEEYFRRLEEANRIPTFTTRINEQGKEVLYKFKGEETDKCPKYAVFLKEFIDPLSELEKPPKMGKFLERNGRR